MPDSRRGVSEKTFFEAKKLNGPIFLHTATTCSVKNLGGEAEGGI